ncbi:MAG: hypothetical protein E7616_05135 [Ruminococcaceae bacterium]|nr:hypothetical protein [Oscillospiraceae bacterium]
MKRVALLLMVSLLMACFLPACGKDKNTSTGPNENPTETTDPTVTPPTNQNPTVKPPEGDDTEKMEPYKHVIVIGVDGAGAYFKNAETPFIDQIFQNGAVTYQMLTSNPTISAQCWGSLLHGVTPVFHKLTNSIVENTPYDPASLFPSFFRVIRENNADAKLASFSHWNPINVGIIEDNIGVHKVGGLSDAKLTDEILAYLENNAPTALFIQFDEADSTGHSVGYGTQKHYEKITEIDSYIGRIFNAYQNKGILDDTLFIVTADHGGNGTSHGGLSDTEKYIMFAARGRTVEKGEIQDAEIRDTAAIVLYALGYSIPDTWTARVPSGLFKGVTAIERPIYVDKNSDRYHETEPTPQKGSKDYITNFIDEKKLLTYLPFDGNVTDICGGNILENGKLYFIDGYYGKGVALDDGSVAINNYAPGNKSFTVSMWLKAEDNSGDPSIISNKDWASGKNKGWILSLRNGKDIRFNAGNGSSRMDADAVLPKNFNEGWMHFLLIVDRESGKIHMSYDFGVMITADIPASLKNASFDAFNTLNLGQDGTGKYDLSLPATMDEFMIFDGALNEAEIASLAAYYHKTVKSGPAFRHQESTPTPPKDSAQYITNYLKDKTLKNYFTFDENSADAMGNAASTEHGTITYRDGIFGKAAVLDKGYISLADYHPGKDSFSVAFWINTGGVSGDPSILSNKNWQSGANKGWILSLRNTHDIKFNFGNGSTRMDSEQPLPGDYKNGWVYVVLVVDRSANKVMFSYDFGEFETIAIPAGLQNASADGYDVLNIGQDGTGKLQYALKASIDELMIFDDVLTQDDITALSRYYGI